MVLQSVLAFTHGLIRSRVQAGDCVLDGTAGNGYDTCLLAELVGSSGRVWAFDVQTAALQVTAERLAARGLAQQVVLVHDGHQHLAAWVDMPLRLAVFNFGYLPGSDKSITTVGESSVVALAAAADKLTAQGLLLAVVYSGHEAGRQEAVMIDAWAASLPQQQFQVLRYGFVNQRNRPPYLLAVAKA